MKTGEVIDRSPSPVYASGIFHEHRLERGVSWASDNQRDARHGRRFFHKKAKIGITVNRLKANILINVHASSNSKGDMMDTIGAKKIIIILVHASAGWVLCGAVMFIGMAMTSVENTMIIHAILVPIIFAVISLIYYRRFNYTSPLQTAVVFLAFIVLLDIFVVSLLINKSLVMFESILGTWIPLASIFIVTYITGILVKKAS